MFPTPGLTPKESQMQEDPRAKSGPEPERLKLDGDWEEAMGEAMKKPRPEDGWPDKPKPDQKRGESSEKG